MRIRPVLLTLAFATPFFLLFAQQPTSVPPQATQLLQKCLTKLVGNQSVTDITLMGTARRIAGSDDEFGTFQFKALPSGESRLDLTLPSGGRGEIRTNSSNGPVGNWYGPDGVFHPSSQHNLWTDPGLLPAFTINTVLTNNYQTSLAANETKEGQSVSHFSVMRQFEAVGAPSGWTRADLQRLTAVDIYLDSTTSLPVAFRFNMHPDQNDLIDIPIEIRFSDYRQVSGTLVPFHVQKYLNDVLAFDFQITAATLNSGLTSASFTTN